jgi:site-specific DNA-methyltransferase (adenine-specific)
MTEMRIGDVELNKVYQQDCIVGMRKIPDGAIDLVVTSPPYDNLRDYNGYSVDLNETGKNIYRILKDGGVAVMVIQDQTKNFGKSLTSFRTIVDWCDNVGFKLFECVIYRKNGTEGAWWKNRFRVDHEYMPIFLKGEKPQYFNKDSLKVKSKHGGKIMTGFANRKTNGETGKSITKAINEMKCRGTVWDYLMAGDKDPVKRKHPAPFPDKIPFDFINCFCPPNGIVLDPFVGSGSTVVGAKKLNRSFIGFDISEEYCNLTRKRLDSVSPDDELFQESRSGSSRVNSILSPEVIAHERGLSSINF